MLLDRYWDTINDLYSRVKTTQRENIIAAGKLIAIDSDALEFVRKMENDWQNANIEYGILNNKRDVDELGILTSEGKYRLWIESLLLTYFGYAPKC